MRKNNALRAVNFVANSALAPTRRALRTTRFPRAHSLKPYGFHSFRKSQSAFSTVPLSRSLSRSLSRWFVCTFSGLGRLSRCPGQPLTHAHMHLRTRGCSGTCGTAGQLRPLSSFSVLNQMVRKMNDCPGVCPGLSRRSSMIGKTNKIWGFYYHD
jgi:hypothetical protein